MGKWFAVPVSFLLAAATASPSAPLVRDDKIAAPLASRAARPPAGGMYGRDAVAIWEGVRGGRVVMSSPANRRSQLRARWVEARPEGATELVLLGLSGAIGRHRLRLVPGVGAELLWAPGGDAIMVTSSAGGRNGVYDLILVDRVSERARERNISDTIRRRFGHPVRCDYPEPPNVAGIAWLPNGNMLVAAEIVHHSICDSYGTFRAYEVSLADLRIVRDYDQIEAKRRFRPLLGWEIAEAPDRCIAAPSECRVASGYDGA